MNKQKILALLAAAVLLMSCLGLSGCADSNRDKTVVVFTYGDYNDPGIFKDFEKATGYTCRVDTFRTPEDMYNKLTAGGGDYDVVCVSDYILERMIADNRMLKIDFDNVPEYKNIMTSCLEQSKSFDPTLEYTVPYFWGVIGILYNKTMVDESKMNSWEVLRDPEYKNEIIMFDSYRDLYSIPLMQLGYSLNTTDRAQLDKAQQWLKEQAPLVSAYMVDEARDEMVGNRAAMATIWSGEAQGCIDSNPNLAFTVPDKGANLWLDSWAIPDTAMNKKGAEAFINYMCGVEASEKNFDYIAYPTPNQVLYDSFDSEVKNNPNIFIPQETLEKCEVFKWLDAETLAYYESLFKKLKG